MATALQTAMIVNIATSENTQFNGNVEPFLDGTAHAVQSATWTSVIVQSAQDKGVLTSLINADLVRHFDAGADSKVELTESGLEVLREFYSVK